MAPFHSQLGPLLQNLPPLLLLMRSKVVLTGAKSVEQLEIAFKSMYPLLCRFKKATVLMQTSAPAAPAASAEPLAEPPRKKSRK